MSAEWVVPIVVALIGFAEVMATIWANRHKAEPRREPLPPREKCADFYPKGSMASMIFQFDDDEGAR